jgi:hypothetical protein
MSKSKSKCPECGGSGVVVLLTSTRPCKTCAARKQQAHLDAARPDVKYTFDAQNRVIRAEYFHPREGATTYKYHEYGPEQSGETTAAPEPPRLGPEMPAPLEGDKRPFVWFHEDGAPGRKLYASRDGWRWCWDDFNHDSPRK